MSTDEARKPKVWDSLPPWERAAAWESKSPETWKVLVEHIAIETKHDHRLAWAEVVKQYLGVVLGFGTVLVMAGVAWHYADIGQPMAGAAIFGTGTASTVAIFVTGRFVGRRRQP